ncbi:MAG: type II secretion system F family protein [Deltaproteobacteria bacterium]
MAEFVCKFGNTSGRVVSETREAATEADLRQSLLSEGYLVFSVQPREALKAKLASVGKAKIRQDDFLIFNEQFLTLSKSGLPLQKSLQMLARQTRSDALRGAIEEVQEKVRAGKLLSEAFDEVAKFPKVYASTLSAGERSGSLDKVLSQYVAYQKARRTFRKKFITSLIYPAFLVVFMAVLVSSLMIWVIPQFSELYKSLDVPLPFLTQLLIDFSHSLQIAGVVLLVLMGAGVIALRVAWQSEATRIAWDRIKFRLPIAGKLLLKFSVAEFARTLSTLLQGGIPVVSALETTRASVSSPLLGRAIVQAKQEVIGGRPLSSGLRRSGFFPPTVLDMVEIGESTGALPTMLDSIAEFFEEDVNIDLSTLVATIDPIMIGIIAIVVAFVLIAFYMPLFSLAGQIH